MTTELSLITAPLAQIKPFAVSSAAIARKDAILADCALIGKVTNADENTTAIKAMQQLQGLSGLAERERKKLKEPIIAAGRQLDIAVKTFTDELDRERGRIECLARDFARIEQTRIEEERKRQELELQEIESKKQAELARIAREQAEIERKAREAREEAERLAREATNKKQREAAERARREAEAQAAEAARTAEAARLKSEAIEEKAGDAAYIAGKPIEAERQGGQVTRKVWVIKQINDFQLIKARPDLVRKVEWDMAGIKDALNRGDKLPGVTAEEDLRVGVRGKVPATIEA